MERKEIGGTGTSIPEIGIGTWNLSGDIRAEIRSIRKGIRMGMDLIDTAEMYGTEYLVGKAISGTDAFIATKVSPHNLRYDDVINACNASLARLKAKHIDLYQVHWPNRAIPISDTMRAMERLVKDGKIRYIGVSNFSAQQVEEAQDALSRERIVSNQVEYSMLVRDIESGLMQYCRKQKITIIAYSPLARGRIFKEKYRGLADVLKVLADKYSKTVSQVVLNWVISKPNVVAIPKASSIEHMTENAGAAGWRMSSLDTRMLNQTLEIFSEKPLAMGIAGPLLRSPSFWSLYGRMKRQAKI